MGLIMRSAFVTCRSYASFQRRQESKVVIQSVLDVTGPDRSSDFPSDWQTVAGIIDHTLLKSETTADQIVRLCEEAACFNFAAVCVNPVVDRTGCFCSARNVGEDCHDHWLSSGANHDASL